MESHGYHLPCKEVPDGIHTHCQLITWGSPFFIPSRARDWLPARKIILVMAAQSISGFHDKTTESVWHHLRAQSTVLNGPTQDPCASLVL